MKNFSSVIFLALLIIFIISILVVKKWKIVGFEGFEFNPNVPKIKLPKIELPTTPFNTTRMPTTPFNTTRMPTTPFMTTQMPTTPFFPDHPFITKTSNNMDQKFGKYVVEPQTSEENTDFTIDSIEISYINNSIYYINLTNKINEDRGELEKLLLFYFSYFITNDFIISEYIRFTFYDNKNKINMYSVMPYLRIINEFSNYHPIPKKIININDYTLYDIKNIYNGTDGRPWLGVIIYFDNKLQTIFTFNDSFPTSKFKNFCLEMCEKSKNNNYSDYKIKVDVYIHDRPCSIIELIGTIQDWLDLNLSEFFGYDICSSN